MKGAGGESATKQKDKININIFLSHDVQDDFSDNEGGAAQNIPVSVRI
jgi:hypothetical protein